MTGSPTDRLTDRKLYVYWCPLCKFQTERSWHYVGRAGLIPQSQEEHTCHRIEVVPLASVSQLHDALQNLVDACQSGHSGMPGGYSIRAPYRSHVDGALAALVSSGTQPEAKHRQPWEEPSPERAIWAEQIAGTRPDGNG